MKQFRRSSNHTYLKKSVGKVSKKKKDTINQFFTSNCKARKLLYSPKKLVWMNDISIFSHPFPHNNNNTVRQECDAIAPPSTPEYQNQTSCHLTSSTFLFPMLWPPLISHSCQMGQKLWLLTEWRDVILTAGDPPIYPHLPPLTFLMVAMCCD